MSEIPLYKDPGAPIDARVEDLLSRMTLEEKGKQLNMLHQSWGAGESFLKNGAFCEEAARESIGDLGTGSIHQREDRAETIAEYVHAANDTQRYMIEKTRLGIPALFISETLHGLVGYSATIYPQAIGLAASWNPDLLERVGAATAAETRACGAHVGLSPVLDVAREHRWGRMEETYGEDPYLVSRLGVAMIRGMQGDSATYASDKIIATPKHFAGHGAPQAGRDSAPVGYGREFLREFALPPFEAAVREAKAGCIMAAYHDWCYVPCSASHELLTEILRDEWGFEGFVIEDMGAVMLLRESHSVAETWHDAARMALEAGVDQSFASPFGNPIIEMVREGKIAEATVDKAVRRVLRAKFQLGLFENPFVDADACVALADCAEHRALARQAARESIVLLKNEGNLLPLNKEIRTLAVIGPNADVAECGDYTGINENKVTPLQGIRQAVSKDTRVLHAKGCSIMGALAARSTPVNTKFLTPKGTARGVAPQPGATGLMAEYFANTDLAGEPVVSRVDNEINFRWGDAAPLDGIEPQNFSVRWTGQIVAEMSDTYKLRLEAADGVRLTVAGRRLIDDWSDGETRPRVADVDLIADQPTEIVLEYYSKTTAAAIQLLWSSAGARSEEAGIAKAVDVAKQADVALVFVGGSIQTSGEIRDVVDLNLTGSQMELIQKVYATGTPVVLVHIGGHVNTMEWAFDHVPAALAAWLPGEEGGNAIADVLFGDYNPSGKLPVEWPAWTGQCPMTYDYMHTGRFDRGLYVFGSPEPRFPFAHGLSYARFRYGNLRVDEKVPMGQNVHVSVDVTNTGDRAGIETVQLYVRDVWASIKRPMRQLKGFRRVELQPGETRTVRMEITPRHLEFWNARMQRVVEPGEFRVFVGGSCATQLEGTFHIEQS